MEKSLFPSIFYTKQYPKYLHIIIFLLPLHKNIDQEFIFICQLSTINYQLKSDGNY